MPLPLVAPTPSFGEDSDTTDTEDVPADRIGPYKLRRSLGRGSSGSEVFLADDGGGSQVALKVLASGSRCDALARFQRESRLTCELPHHVNLVAGLGYAADEKHSYIAMKLVAGAQTLQDVLMESGALEWRRAAEVAMQLADALAHLHAHGITHRDVKPENVIIDRSTGAAVLIDLGLARPAAAEDDDAAAAALPVAAAAAADHRLLRVTTPAFCAIGSPAFMAPEQVADARCARHAADVYGLGASLYAMLTSRLPFDGASPAKVMQQVLAGAVRPPSAYARGLPPAVDALVLWLMRREPSARPASRGVRAAVQAVLDHADNAARLRELWAAVPLREEEGGRDAGWSWVRRAATGAVVLMAVGVACAELAAMRPDGGGAEVAAIELR